VKLAINAHKTASMSAVGDSIAVNGACLTVLHLKGDILAFDISGETLRSAATSSFVKGARVNLETALCAGDKLGGHFVLGHVDAAGKVVSTKPAGETSDGNLEIEIPEGFEKLLIPKGSIAVDGVSLTIANVRGRRFDCAVLEYTWSNTTFGDLIPGSLVNIEFDYIVKSVHSALAGMIDSAGLSFERLKSMGY